MAEVDSPVPPATQRPTAPLVATGSRWLAVSLALEIGLAAGIEGLLLFTHKSGSAGTFAWPLAVGATAGWIVVYAMLRAEESRLARELRIARTGTAVLRAMVARRRLQMPFLTRWSASSLGAAAVLLADGDRDGALDALRTSPIFMRGGRLDALRAFVEADLERNSRTAAGLDRCIRRLRVATPTGNREADLYRIHVLAKATLERGDDETADELAAEWSGAADDDVRVYATWIRVWFELDGDDQSPLGELSEADLRIALLAARAHGAENLVTKLTERLSAIARAESQG